MSGVYLSSVRPLAMISAFRLRIGTHLHVTYENGKGAWNSLKWPGCSFINDPRLTDGKLKGGLPLLMVRFHVSCFGLLGMGEPFDGRIWNLSYQTSDVRMRCPESVLYSGSEWSSDMV